MNPQEESSAPNTTPVQKPQQGGFGPIFAIIVIIILLALGGLYYFTEGVEQVQDTQQEETGDETVDALMQQGDSDEIADIEADLDATDLSEVEDILDDIDAELEAEAGT